MVKKFKQLCLTKSEKWFSFSPHPPISFIFFVCSSRDNACISVYVGIRTLLSFPFCLAPRLQHILVLIVTIPFHCAFGQAGSSLTFWARSCCVVKGCCAHWRTFSSIADPYPLMPVPPPHPPCDTEKFLQTLPSVPWRTNCPGCTPLRGMAAEFR